MSTRKLRRKYRPVSREKLVSGKSRIIKRTLAYRREIDTTKKWYVIRANPGREHRAILGLRALGADVYRPVEDRWRINKLWCSDISQGRFSRYIFVGFEKPAPFEAIRNTHGVAGLVKTTNGDNAVVAGEVLQRIADEMAGQRKAPPMPFKEGQEVMVRLPIDDPEGVLDPVEIPGVILDLGDGVATVEIPMFGKTHVQELDFLDLKAA